MQEAKVLWNVHAIGETAGQVWQFLSESGKSTINAIEWEIDAPAALTHMSIGWLVREGKLQIAQDGRSVSVWLAERS